MGAGGAKVSINPVLVKEKRGLENASLGGKVPIVCLQRRLSRVKVFAFRLDLCKVQVSVLNIQDPASVFKDLADEVRRGQTAAILGYPKSATKTACTMTWPSLSLVLPLGGKPTFMKAPEDQIGISGGVASFVCQATGEPKPRITWMKKGKKVSSQRFEVIEFDDGSGSVLRIQPLRVHRDEAIYECTATNSVGEINTSAKLTVLEDFNVSAFCEYDSFIIINIPLFAYVLVKWILQLIALVVVMFGISDFQKTVIISPSWEAATTSAAFHVTAESLAFPCALIPLATTMSRQLRQDWDFDGVGGTGEHLLAIRVEHMILLIPMAIENTSGKLQKPCLSSGDKYRDIEMKTSMTSFCNRLTHEQFAVSQERVWYLVVLDDEVISLNSSSDAEKNLLVRSQ
ncbi:hypothetical protein WISP_110539 [Willisornis vidua]|uniref:Ig-like domain-containing protein n=1 Tax=Willisornis vidua TaxID=1566151 RepID=A0ABQ9CVP3_9PASS|nr:hypothetical protein WISP_110539 [Willisornis vidua]